MKHHAPTSNITAGRCRLSLAIRQLGQRQGLRRLLFPRLKERGPIEATSLQRHFFLSDLFPRLKERGPIEAAQRPTD